MFIGSFNHARGIRPFRTDNLFARIFSPTLALFDFEIKKLLVWSLKSDLSSGQSNQVIGHLRYKAFEVELLF